jgi:hypothetical protein
VEIIPSKVPNKDAINPIKIRRVSLGCGFDFLRLKIFLSELGKKNFLRSKNLKTAFTGLLFNLLSILIGLMPFRANDFPDPRSVRQIIGNSVPDAISALNFVD